MPKVTDLWKKADINKAVMKARRYIIEGHYETANKDVYEAMLKQITGKVFQENALELLPAYFILAEANIGMGGHRLKKAEEFLIAAKWNLLQKQDDKNEEK